MKSKLQLEIIFLMITNLIFVEFAVFELSLSLLSKCNDDKTHKYVHHEEGDDDDVDDEKDGDFYSVVVNGASIYGVGIDGPVQKPLGKNKIKKDKASDTQDSWYIESFNH